MVSEYVSNVANLFTNREVTARESIDGSTFLLAVVLVAVTVGVAWWWRHRHA